MKIHMSQESVAKNIVCLRCTKWKRRLMFFFFFFFFYLFFICFLFGFYLAFISFFVFFVYDCISTSGPVHFVFTK